MTSFDTDASNQPAATGTVEPAVCPALGLTGDRATHFLLASDHHRCFAARVTRQIPFEHQYQFCLTAKYQRCPIWEQSLAASQESRGADSASSQNRSWLTHPRLLALADLHIGRPRLPRPGLPSLRLPGPHVPRPAAGRQVALASASLLVVLLLIAGVALVVSRRSSRGGSPVAATVEATAAATVAASRSTPFASREATPIRAAALADDRVLRPGATLVKRLNVSLDGSANGNAVVASRVSSPAGCDRWFLDVYAYDQAAARFVDLFDGTAANPPGTGIAAALLSAPVKNERGCFPRVDLLDSRTFESMNRPVAIAAIAGTDGRTRVVAISIANQSNTIELLYDLTAGVGGAVQLLDNPSRVELSENAFAPAIAGITDPGLGAVGTFQQILGGSGGTFGVLSRTLISACSDGTVAAKQEIGGERWLRLKCRASSGGGNAVFVLAVGAGIQPAGASFERLLVGDDVTLSLDGTVRPPGDAANAVAVASAVRVRGISAGRFAPVASPVP